MPLLCNGNINCNMNTVWKVSKYGIFLVRIFPYSNRIRRDIPNLSVFSPNAGKYGSEKTPYLDNFRAEFLLLC